MKKFLFPIVLLGSICIGIAAEMASGPGLGPYEPAESASPDTVIYPSDNYRARRKGNFDAVQIADSLLGGPDTLAVEMEDTVVHLTARDTMKVPDSLRYTDPFAFKYYIAIHDSLTHRQVSDSLKNAGDSLKTAFENMLDSLYLFRSDSAFADRHRLDSLYFRDSTAKVKAAFEAWYNSLDPDARKKYDFEQKEKRKLAIRDSLDDIKAEKQARKDSIRKATPRILEAYAIPDSMYYKRLIAWNTDRDFQDLDVFVPDTGYNYRFHDYKFQREDVNATWLGVPGSPVQTYNWFQRKSSGVDFWDPMESWTFSPQTLLQYNTKTPYTELAYFGTLLSSEDKEADNIHILSTQNITPALNFSILYDRWGGGGMLINEKVKNKTFAFGLNYVGTKYTANVGFINNSIEMGENGGIVDLKEIRDTTIDSREVKVAMTSAVSKLKKRTLFADQQLKIPVDFIGDLIYGKDSTATREDFTTAFVGHGIEYTTYSREFINGSEADSLGQSRLDNKLYIRLQPWTEDAFISKIDFGVGDYLHSYHTVTAADTTRTYENSLYAYAGAKGHLGDGMNWSAKAHYVFGGADAGNFDASARVDMRFYPFRKARKSPLSIYAQASESLLRPNYYQRHMYSTVNPLMRWDNDFSRVSTTKIEGGIDIPYWKMHAKAGYALVGNPTFYNTLGVIDQHSGSPVSIISADLRKEFVIADFLHLDNRILGQYSSNQEVLPLPALSLNLRWFAQFPVKEGVMDMQIGADVWANTKWYSPQWNHITGTFANQDEWQYYNGPFFDVFMNIQWKRVTLFVKAQNLGQGWPMDHADYFSAHRHIITQGGGTGIKLGIWWPLSASTEINRPVSR